jgi:hypothetical protein
VEIFTPPALAIENWSLWEQTLFAMVKIFGG